ncbi:Uncharacterised protein [Vibrio cholerae]|uniref:Uncharacterized protein n=1 Tax=Vibrio cholerae TaxID=666 RepID=A0A655S594_VIBCL|nr:Uncharacterised protein [Vibrio cholerae]CSB12879.1 Uncharacterised protein [Vibrio cholerae]CSB51551.1 Uncharacterised protein [Vibrio cholerae]CSB53897.1 Uncharacterised protein [Vibrio cholerae]CSD37708.1 Uncharacterised protein [Vibrio cholerae]
MRFHFHQNVGIFMVISVLTALGVGEETANGRARHYCGIIFISRKHIIRRLFKGVFDHFEQ